MPHTLLSSIKMIVVQKVYLNEFWDFIFIQKLTLTNKKNRF